MQQPIDKPIPTDGLRSRKFIVTVAGTLFIEGSATIAYWLDKMDTDQWIGLSQWLFPIVLTIFCGTTATEKFVYRSKE